MGDVRGGSSVPQGLPCFRDAHRVGSAGAVADLVDSSAVLELRTTRTLGTMVHRRWLARFRARCRRCRQRHRCGAGVVVRGGDTPAEVVGVMNVELWQLAIAAVALLVTAAALLLALRKGAREDEDRRRREADTREDRQRREANANTENLRHSMETQRTEILSAIGQLRTETTTQRTETLSAVDDVRRNGAAVGERVAYLESDVAHLDTRLTRIEPPPAADPFRPAVDPPPPAARREG